MKSILAFLTTFFAALLPALCAAGAAPPKVHVKNPELPVVLANPGVEFQDAARPGAMIIGMDRTPQGRIWGCWTGTGDKADGYFLLATSDDDGSTWSKPRLAVGPMLAADQRLSGALVGNLWTDPHGRLWLFFDQHRGDPQGRITNWFIRCDDPDTTGPSWSEPVCFAEGCTLNKPTVLDNGDWLLPVSDCKVIHGFGKEQCLPIRDDSILQAVKWEGKEDLSAVAGKEARFRFHLTQGALYAFWVSPDASGKSGGYLAAGGPGYDSLSDTLGKHHAYHRQRDSLLPAEVHTAPLPARYQDENRMFLCGPGIAVSPGGRLWVTFKSGDITEDEDNCTIVVTSGDRGETWSKPVLAVDIDGPVRTNDPGIWTDPNGKVTLMFGQVCGFWDGRGGLWTMTAENGDDEHTKWSAPVRLCDGYTKNKPFVTKDGRWLYLIEHMGPKGWRGRYAEGAPMEPGLIHPRPELNHANVFVSDDQGKTLSFLGQSTIPKQDKTYQEHMIVEKKDGTLWMLGRTKYGVGEAFSRDGGRTWTEMAPAKRITGPSSRFFFQRLTSGNLLLIKNGPTIDEPSGRTHMTAYLSEDDGATWPYHLLLDERATSYPDAAQDKDGVLHVVHDFGRYREKIVCYHRITEADIRAGRLVTQGSRLGGIANQATHPTIDATAYEAWRVKINSVSPK